MPAPTIEVDRTLATELTEERVEAVLRRLDFSVTGPRPDTFSQDIVACSCSSSCCRPRAPK